jgi:ParB family chromosome partitioning protein
MAEVRSHTSRRGNPGPTEGADTPPARQDGKEELRVQWVPIESIRIPNPRGRDRKKHRRITESIERVGLKKPITLRSRPDGGYDLVCGQGRLESFQQLGQTMVPALVREVSEEEMLLMSLVENMARRTPRTMETVRQLAALRDKEYSHAQIGEKVGLAPNHVSELLYLYDHGEEHLLAAAETGRIPLSAAIIIARSDDAEVQAALLDALERRKLTSSEVRRARRLAEMRRAFGKGYRPGTKRAQQPVTGESIVKAFRREQMRQRQALKKAELCERRLAFVISSFRLLLADEDFVNLLRAENLTTLPEHLAEQVKQGATNG